MTKVLTKIGEMLTFFPREVRHVYRCYNDNGFKYTVDKIITTITGQNKKMFCQQKRQR